MLFDPKNLPDRGDYPPGCAALGPAPVALTCSGRGSLDAGGQTVTETHGTAVRVPFPHPRNHGEEIANAVFLRDQGAL